ncbi:MAG TPA: DUF559 domain-containing protein [Bacteroidales bacterium]|nr:DUF559 domain-containing protein [Bacteroidales bacterium]HRX97390.1 DUF559 domain-containing protein [Bacteroidales bacterium]
MELKLLKPRKALNKAFLKVKPNRSEIEKFKTNLVQLVDNSNEAESEEFHKNLVSDFLKKTWYAPQHFINTKGRNDLVIHNGDKATSTVGVIIEAKKPTNKSEMLSIENLNAKAFHELILYYLRERIIANNLEIKHLVATNINEWFIFDARVFEKYFAHDKILVKQFNDFEAGRLSGTTTDFFYHEIAEPFIEKIKSEIEFTWFDIREYEIPLRNNNQKDDNKLIALFKLLSPEHMLKLPFANDSNSLDKRFYTELLHIIGLTETKQGSKKLIERNPKEKRNSGSLLENAILQLDSLDKIGRLEKPGQYGEMMDERLFNVGLELCITWINRILFLKLLEAQLLSYHNGDKAFEFLSSKKIRNYDDLNTLFFQVLARKTEDRNEDVCELFANVPYLNSSLFDPTELEHLTLFISNLNDEKTIPILSTTVLKDDNGKKKTGKLTTLDYLFQFLNAYDFSSEGSEEIQEENKTLINASVLGLIFEKINGYKDGSFFTPGFITMYMSRETIRRAVVQKFNEVKNWRCENIDELYDKIDNRQEANRIVNSLKICDPAVGSGHFLVSALNEIISIKNDLRILSDRNGQRLKEYNFEVVNDELIVTDENGELFEYNPKNRESQRVQEALFHEKQTLIENCLFGVDINPNSVKICRLRLWIELLKNAYYISSSPDKGRWPEAGGVRRLHNLPHLKHFRKELRKNLTPAEATLWTILQKKKLDGRKFRRQHSVSNYILDFYCPSEHLAIELDGEVHNTVSAAEYDAERDLFLLHTGIKVLRFENKMVFEQPDMLLEAIRQEFGKNQPPRPQADTPPLEGGEPGELQTLPNIDINIKTGNSLISRFAIDADLGQALKKSKWTIDSYRMAVDTYRNAENKEQKRQMEKLISDIKNDFRSEITLNDPKVKRLIKIKGDITTMTTQTQMFELTAKQKAEWNKKLKKLIEEQKKLEAQIEEIKNNKIYENAFEWRFEFPEVLNEKGNFTGFDVVIGNPPYFQIQRSEINYSFVKDRYQTYEQTGDVYVLFYELGKLIQSQHGILCFITSNKWLRAGYGKKLRKFLVENTNCKLLIDFNYFQVFTEASVDTNILMYRTGSKDFIESAVLVKDNFDLTLIEKYVIDHSTTLRNLTENYWNIVNENRHQLNKKINEVGKKIKDWNLSINYGIKTGLNEAFIINEELKNNLIGRDDKNAKILVPYIRGRDTRRFGFKHEQLWLINSHNGLKELGIEPINIERDFPTIFEYLKQFEGKAVKRADQGNHWTNLRNCAYLKDFEKEKIVYAETMRVHKSDIYNFPRFGFDDRGFYCDKTTFIATGENIKYLLGVLNSKLGNYLVREYITKLDTGGYMMQKVFLDEIPILPPPDNEAITDIVYKIIEQKQQDILFDTSLLESQIDQLVYELYGLTEEEIAIVEDSIK